MNEPTELGNSNDDLGIECGAVGSGSLGHGSDGPKTDENGTTPPLLGSHSSALGQVHEVNDAHQRSRRMRRRKRGSGAAAAPLTPRARRLYVVRESDAYKYEAFDLMIDQTLLRHKGDPGVDAALESKSIVVQRTKHAEQLRRELDATEIKGVGWWWRAESDVFFYALASAANLDRGTNRFTDALCDLIDLLKPEELHAGPFSRFVRDRHVGAQISLSARRSRTTVFADEFRGGLDLNSTGSLIWDALSLAVDHDRTATVTRNLVGALYALRNNQWPRAEVVLPLGYQFTDAAAGDSSVVPSGDPLVRRQVSQLITSAANPAMSLPDIARELAKLGVLTRDISPSKRRPIDQAADPASSVRTLLDHLPTYLDGVYVFTHTNSLPHLDSVAGLDVIRDASGDPGYFSVPLQFGLPAGEWAPRDDILRAIDLRLNAAHTIDADALPLPPQQYSDSTHDYKISARNDRYTLRQRPTSASKFGKNDGIRTAAFDPLGVHRRLAGGVTEALDSGVASDLLGTSDSELEQLIRSATDDADQARSLAEAYAREAATCSDEADAMNYRRLAGDQWALERESRRMLTELEAELAVVGTTGLVAKFAELAAVLAELCEEARPSRVVTSALRAWIDRWWASVDETGRTATISVVLRVPTALRVIRLGPITFRVPVLGHGSRDGLGGSVTTSLYIAELLAGREIEDLARQHGVNAHPLDNRLRRYLRGLGASTIAAAAMTSHPLPEVRRLLYADLRGEPGDASAEGGFSPDWNQRIIDTYTSYTGRKSPRIFSPVDHELQQILDAAERWPGRPIGEVAAELRVPMARIRAASRSGVVAVRESNLYPAPEFGTAFDTASALPEVPDGLLLADTLTTPAGLVLPEQYARLFERRAVQQPS